MRLAQGMFERKLRGLFQWGGSVIIDEAQEADKLPGKRRAAFGKFKEIVSMRFGDYTLVMHSSNEVPPLGRVELFGPPGRIQRDSLDGAVLDELGEEICKHERMLSDGP